MYISSLELADFRNIASLHMEFSQGTNILYGENAQGKTNILESMYMLSTTKSHRGVRDRDMIRFGVEEAHIRSQIMKGGLDHRIDMHLRKNKSKGIAIDGQRIRKASELIGLLHIVFFSPEDLGIVKNGPAERRRFMDMELCQLDAAYLHDLGHEYMRMFIGPEKLVAPPWESVYRSKEGLLFQESTLTIREIYRKEGYLPEGYPKVPDDSLPLELNFMYRMAARSLEALQNDQTEELSRTLAVQESFIRVHLLYFVPKLLERMEASAFRLFYPQMTKILVEFLKLDLELVQDMMKAEV
jgi:TorA maturation chaperone TorD